MKTYKEIASILASNKDVFALSNQSLSIIFERDINAIRNMKKGINAHKSHPCNKYDKIAHSMNYNIELYTGKEADYRRQIAKLLKVKIDPAAFHEILIGIVAYNAYRII